MRRSALLLVLLLFSLRIASASSTNLVPNSSAECGYGRGWIPWGTGNNPYLGVNCFVSGLVTNIAFHGGSSFVVLQEARWQGAAIWATTNNGTNLCLSYYIRTASGSAGGVFKAGLLYGNQLNGGTPPNQNGNVTGSWTRQSTNFTITSNCFLYVKLYNTQGPVFVDAIQLEYGTTPTTYAPQSPMESGILLGGTYGMYFSGQTGYFTNAFWNEGAASSAHLEYIVYDAWNSNVLSATVTVPLAAATNTLYPVALPAKNGWFKIMTRLLDYDKSYDEGRMNVYPYTSNFIMTATNGWLGGHPQGNSYHIHKEKLAGRQATRSLGPNFIDTRWWQTNNVSGGATGVEPTRGNLTFFNYTYTNLPTFSMFGVGCLTPEDGQWTYWATNANGTFDGMAFSNFCFFAVLTNKFWIHAWEIGPNEPYQTGPHGFGPSHDDPTNGGLVPNAGLGDHTGGTNLPVNVQVATNYAKVLAYGVSGITNADPTAFIIGIAGASGDGTWALEAWTNLTANIRSWISAVSTHQYPPDQSFDPNDAFLVGVSANANVASGYVTAFRNTPFGGVPVFNTESAAYGIPPVEGLNGLWPNFYNPLVSSTAAGNEALSRQLTETTRILSQALRCIGFGVRKFFYYDSRDFNDSAFDGNQPYPADAYQVDRPEMTSLAVAQYKFAWGYGPGTNASFPYLEMYTGTNALGQNVVVAWSAGRTNLTLTTTNGNFVGSDAFGNDGVTNATTIRITRLPQFFTSGTLSAAQLSNTFCFATVANAADVVAPLTSIDIAPIGLWGSDTNAQLFKWTSIDDTAVAWPTTAPNNVTYKWRMDTDSYNSYSTSNSVWIPNLTPGNHTFYVKAKDITGNEAEISYQFSNAPPAVSSQSIVGPRLKIAGRRLSVPR